MTRNLWIYVGGFLAAIYAWHTGMVAEWLAAIEDLAAALGTLGIVAATLGALWYLGAPKLTGSGLV